MIRSLARYNTDARPSLTLRRYNHVARACERVMLYLNYVFSFYLFICAFVFRYTKWTILCECVFESFSGIFREHGIRQHNTILDLVIP